MPSPQTSPLNASTNLPVSVQGYPIAVGGSGGGGTKCKEMEPMVIIQFFQQ